MRKGQSDEVKVELKLSEIGGVVVIWIKFAIFVDNSSYFVGEEGLFIERSLLYGFVEEG